MYQYLVIMQCPYSHKGESITVSAESPSFCLVNNHGKLELKKDHAYYYQVLFTQVFNPESNYFFLLEL